MAKNISLFMRLCAWAIANRIKIKVTDLPPHSKTERTAIRKGGEHGKR